VPLYFWANMIYLAIALSLIWAYYSPAVSPLVYSRYFYVTQRFTQVSELIVGMYLWRYPRPRFAFIGAINIVYAAIKTGPYIDHEVSEEVQRSFAFSLQQWANLAVIIASYIALAWCHFKMEETHGTAEEIPG
jgi:hypothetical protein